MADDIGWLFDADDDKSVSIVSYKWGNKFSFSESARLMALLPFYQLYHVVKHPDVHKQKSLFPGFGKGTSWLSTLDQVTEEFTKETATYTCSGQYCLAQQAIDTIEFANKQLSGKDVKIDGADLPINPEAPSSVISYGDLGVCRHIVDCPKRADCKYLGSRREHEEAINGDPAKGIPLCGHYLASWPEKAYRDWPSVARALDEPPCRPKFEDQRLKLFGGLALLCEAAVNYAAVMVRRVMAFGVDRPSFDFPPTKVNIVFEELSGDKERINGKVTEIKVAPGSATKLTRREIFVRIDLPIQSYSLVDSNWMQVALVLAHEVFVHGLRGMFLGADFQPPVFLRKEVDREFDEYLIDHVVLELFKVTQDFETIDVATPSRYGDEIHSVIDSYDRLHCRRRGSQDQEGRANAARILGNFTKVMNNLFKALAEWPFGDAAKIDQSMRTKIFVWKLLLQSHGIIREPGHREMLYDFLSFVSRFAESLERQLSKSALKERLSKLNESDEELRERVRAGILGGEFDGGDVFSLHEVLIAMKIFIEIINEGDLRPFGRGHVNVVETLKVGFEQCCSENQPNGGNPGGVYNPDNDKEAKDMLKPRVDFTV